MGLSLHSKIHVQPQYSIVALFPGSPIFHAIRTRMTFDSARKKVGGDHVNDVMFT